MSRRHARWWRWPPATRQTRAGKRRGRAGCWGTRRRHCCWLPRRGGWRAGWTKPSAALRATGGPTGGCVPGLSRVAAASDGARGLGRSGVAGPAGGGGASGRDLAARGARAAGRADAASWTEALAMADADAPKAALATAAANAETDPGRAFAAGAPGLEGGPRPGARRTGLCPSLARGGAGRRAQGVIRQSWAVAPHPDLADFALAPVDGQASARAGRADG